MTHRNSAAIFSGLLALLAIILLVFCPYINLGFDKYNLIDMLKMQSYNSNAIAISVVIIISSVCSVVASICSIFYNIPCKIIHILFSLIGIVINGIIISELPSMVISIAPIIYIVATVISMILILLAKKTNYDFLTSVDMKKL